MTQAPKTLEEWQAFAKGKQVEKSSSPVVPAPVMNTSGTTKVIDLDKLENKVADLEKRIAQIQDGSYGFSTTYSYWRPKVEELIVDTGTKLDILFQRLERLSQLLDIDLTDPTGDIKDGEA